MSKKDYVYSELVNQGLVNKELYYQKLEKLNLNKTQIRALEPKLFFYISTIKKQKLNNSEIARVIEDYLKSTVKIVEPYDDIRIYSKELRNRHNSAYAALLEKEATPLGMIRAVKFLLDILEIDSYIGFYETDTFDYGIINYVVVQENNILIDPYNSLIDNKNMVKPKDMECELNISKLDESFFDLDIDFFKKHDVDKYAQKYIT